MLKNLTECANRLVKVLDLVCALECSKEDLAKRDEKELRKHILWSRSKYGSAFFDSFVDLRYVVIADPGEKSFKEIRLFNHRTDSRVFIVLLKGCHWRWRR